ncbi:MaoC family dehydratase [Nocardia asiatica]|uniref:MaoC family dehydratase n=1 Tax=Nocardia asiatica TaxID=209252 RepID=UPI003EDEF622
MSAAVEPVDVRVGTALPELVIDVDPTFVISTALATRDFQDVHHDRDKAVARGSKDIFVNILTDTGLVQRFVTDWAGPRAVVKSVALRLGVPLYAGDTLTLTGTVTALEGDDIHIDVVGRDSLGDHITATAVIALRRSDD